MKNLFLHRITPMFAVCASLGFVACQDDDERPISYDGNVAIWAKMDQGRATRTCVGGTTANGQVGIEWLPGDSIGVYGSAGTLNAAFTSTADKPVAEAWFGGALAAGETPLYAYYPYSSDNASSPVTALRGNLSLRQAFNLSTGQLEEDYKVGQPTSDGNGTGQWEFTFSHLFSLLRFDIDAAGTALADDRLESITLTLPEGRRLGGEFTFDATNGEISWAGTPERANELVMNWTDRPTFEDGARYTGYMTCAPDIREGDAITVTIMTTNHRAVFTRTALVDFEPNASYTFPLTLANYDDDWTVTTRPSGFTSFSFDVANNEGKILGTKLVYGEYEVEDDSWWPFPGGTTTETGTHTVAVTSESMTVGEDTVSGCIPYLYDFNLKPTFAVGEGVEVTVGGQPQVSGESVQDFSRPVTYTLSKDGESREVTVVVTNTGLPVVVLEQGSVGEFEEWAEAGISIRSKSSDWGEDDHIWVYNADGTVNVADALCGSRLRGNSTQEFPKKPLAIKLDKKASVLGMPEHKRWVLLANWMDRTMLRNAMAFKVAQAVGDVEGGMGWNPHGYNVELVIDGRHVGNYYLCEQIKIDGGRVDINDCYEDVVEDGNANPTVADCGYLLEFDNNMDEVNVFRTEQRGLPVMFKDELPLDDSRAMEIFEAVRTKIQGVEDHLYAGDYAAAYQDLDVTSVIDWFLVQEALLHNEYRLPNSAYVIIDGDGPLTAGPVWDFDWQSFSDESRVNALYSQYPIGWHYGMPVEGWLYALSSKYPNLEDEYGQPVNYMWYPLLFKDESFRRQVQDRWTVAYPAMLSVMNEFDRLADENRLSDEYNQKMWPLMEIKASGVSAWNGDENLSFDEAMDLMREVYRNRLTWMNSAITSGNFVTNGN